MQIDHKKFFDGYREAYGQRKNAGFGKVLTAATVSGVEQLGQLMESDPNLTDLRWAAYMLATVKHECANEWHPITERGQRAYFDKYNAGTKLGKALGNTQRGDGFRFRGRGYVQITGRANYAKMRAALSMGLIRQS